LTESWHYQSRHAPRPAWQGEAKWDGWNKVYDLKPRQIFDRAYHVVVAQGLLYFGSSADDKVYCLDAADGRERWTFFTEGPVRFAPTVHKGKLFFGSDDGYIYCLEARTGELIWKTRPGPRNYRIPGNGRVISAWPIRTGLVVQEGKVYATAGMFPSEGVYLCALDAETGAIEWKTVQNDLPAQGYLLASSTRLYVPAGRNNPVICAIADGQRIRVVDGAGGTYALLTGDTLIFGPGKTGQLGLVGEDQKDQLASFAGNHMIVTPAMSYLHSDTELSALDRRRYVQLIRTRTGLTAKQGQLARRLRDAAKKPEAAGESAALRTELLELGRSIDAVSAQLKECIPWTRPCEHSYALILAGEILFAGGGNEVAAFGVRDGKMLWTGPVRGNAYGLAVAGGRLFVSTDQGSIHSFESGKLPAALP
jgi:outer membrane protein assembly factor BamB